MTSQDLPYTSPLLALLRMMTEDEQNDFAARAGTKRGYLYQVAGGHRSNVSVQLAFGIEDASRQLHRESNKKFPIVTARQLAEMGALNGLLPAG